MKNDSSKFKIIPLAAASGIPKFYILRFTFLIFFVIGFLFLAALPASAACPPDCGLVPACAGSSCTPCYFLQLISNVTLFIVLDITAPLAGLLFLIGGIMMVSAGGSEARLKKGKDIIKNTAIGVLIVLASWAIVNTLITALGSNVAGFIPGGNWWQVNNCTTPAAAPVTTPATAPATVPTNNPPAPVSSQEQLRAQCESSPGSVWRNGQCEYIP